jgi:hypothetical protein
METSIRSGSMAPHEQQQVSVSNQSRIEIGRSGHIAVIVSFSRPERMSGLRVPGP